MNLGNYLGITTILTPIKESSSHFLGGNQYLNICPTLLTHPSVNALPRSFINLLGWEAVFFNSGHRRVFPVPSVDFVDKEPNGV